MNKVKEFFWLCSGSHIKLLSEAPSEAAKYAGIGATIFFTGIFAAMASGYAIYTFSASIWLAASAGLVWGFMIFNLDRYIVSSMRKSNSWKKEWGMATPRIILALIISLVIARPLELKIFEKEIATEIIKINAEITASNIDSINAYYNQLIAGEQQDIDRLQLELTAKEDQRNELRSQAAAEADGTGGTLRRNAGPIYQIKKADADRVEQELSQLRRTSLAIIESKRTAQAQWQEENKLQLDALAVPDYTGFAARLEAFGRLTSKNYNLWLANIFIILLFIAIETAPVFVKLISTKGPYDYLLETKEYEYEMGWLLEKAKINSRTRKSAKKLAANEVEYIDHYLLSSLE